MNPINSPFQPFMVYSSEFDPTESKILSFGSFKLGWHYQKGIAFSGEAIRDALIVHRQIFFKGFTRTNAFPGPTGEILVTMYHENHYFGFEREASGLWNITHERNGKETEPFEQKTFDEVISYVNALNTKICDTFDVYSRVIGTLIEKSSLITPSNATKMASPLLTRTACLLGA
jgi:hypothetical protein